MAKKKAERPPPPTKADKSKNSRTILAQQAFLAAFIENNGNVTRAAEAAGVIRQTFYDWKKTDPEFVRQLEEVDQVFADRLEEAARNFAFEGDTTLLIFLLKALRRTKYDDQVARIKWQTDNQIADPNAAPPTQVILVREDGPHEMEGEGEALADDEMN